MNKFIIRSITAIIFAAIMLTSIFVGKWLLLMVMGFFLSLTLIEQGNFVTFKKPGTIFYVVSGLLFYILGILGNTTLSYRQWAAIIVIYYISTFCLLLIQKSYLQKQFTYKLFSLFYITIPFILFTRLFGMSQDIGLKPYMLPICVICTTWIGDTFAYIVGSLIGKHKMSPKISPNKSWEGFFGGMTFVIIAGAILANYSHIEININEYIFWILFCLTIYIFGTLGDLYESSLKRTANIKDSGKILPGHGGVYDRFDSFLMSVPFSIIYLLTLLF